MNIDVEEVLEQDDKFQEGLKEYKTMEEKANSVSQEISNSIVESIIKEQDKFNITTAFLALGKALTSLSSYLYDSEEEFLTDVKKARTSVINDIIPALLDPQPCGECQNCKNGIEEECINPIVRGDYTQSRFLPILCNMLIEYDLFNKVIHMHINKDDSSDVALEPEKKEEN